MFLKAWRETAGQYPLSAFQCALQIGQILRMMPSSPLCCNMWFSEWNYVTRQCERSGSSRISTRCSNLFLWLPLPTPRPPAPTPANFFTRSPLHSRSPDFWPSLLPFHSSFKQQTEKVDRFFIHYIIGNSLNHSCLVRNSGRSHTHSLQRKGRPGAGQFLAKYEGGYTGRHDTPWRWLEQKRLSTLWWWLLLLLNTIYRRQGNDGMTRSFFICCIDYI